MISLSPLYHFCNTLKEGINLDQFAPELVSKDIKRQMKIFRFSENPFIINDFSGSDFSDPDICNQYLFLILQSLKEQPYRMHLFNQDKLERLVHCRDKEKATSIQFLISDNLHSVTPVLRILYQADRSLFSGNIHNDINYPQLMHYLTDYIFRYPHLDIREDMLMKAWFVHILYSVFQQEPDKEKQNDLFFLTKLFFEQSYFSVYHDHFNMVTLSHESFFFLDEKQRNFSLSEYLMLAKEDMYYAYKLNHENFQLSDNLIEYFKAIKHSINNESISVLIEKYILQSKVVKNNNAVKSSALRI